MNKKEFANLLEGFDFNIIEEYWLRVKSSDNISFQLVYGFEKELDSLDQLEERIDKAIEYINYCLEENCEDSGDYLDNTHIGEKLISILRGDLHE